MDKEKQRIKIAEALGYTHVRIVKAIEGPPDIGIGHHPTEPHSIPDYLNDLNAINNALAYLTPKQLEQWAVELTAIVLENNSGAWWDLNINETAQVLSATAEQWAEAFLRTLNLWEE